MPGVDELMAIFKEKFTAICHQIFEYGLEKNAERQAEVKMFWECVEEAKQENKEMGMKKIKEFTEYKKEVWFYSFVFFLTYCILHSIMFQISATASQHR